MAFVPITESGLDWEFDNSGFPGGSFMFGNTINVNGTYPSGSPEWFIRIVDPGQTVTIRFQLFDYRAEPSDGPGTGYVGPASVVVESGTDQENQTAPSAGVVSDFTPNPVDLPVVFSGDGIINFYPTRWASDSTEEYQCEVYVEIGAGPGPEPETPSGTKRTAPQKAYETDKGWSFDGNYIPHFVILNWYFADNPVIYKGFQKVRIHGLSKGRSFLQLSVNGIEDDYVNEADGFTTPQYIDIPKAATFVVEDFKPATNYTDTANRGLGVQFKFEGRNTNIALPEPAHVIQVLVLQGTPDSTGKRAN